MGTDSELSRDASTSASQQAQESVLVAAGCYAESLYKTILPAWRFKIRRALVRCLQAEVPHLAAVQNAVRHPILDALFHFTSFFGTHSSFLLFLPPLCWFGLPHIAFQFVFVLSLGVFLSSAIKDCLCVPRPFSPPVSRLTLVSSHAREYGFPSTHSTNAVGLALLLFSYTGPLGKVAVSVYATTIVLGRMYTGMHSAMDCLGGIALAFMQHFILWPFYHATFTYAQNPSISTPFLLTLATLFLITIHPQPVDPCPCFEDGVAFMSVTLGILLGHWAVSFSGVPWVIPGVTPADSPVALVALSVLKLAVGVAIILLYRLAAKQIMHLILPNIISFTAKFGLDFSRRHYVPSHSYTESYAKEDPTILHPVPSMIHLPDASSPLKANGDEPSSPARQLRHRKKISDLHTEKANPSEEDEDLPPPTAHHYDADVLTKVVCYSGIGFLAAFGIPWVFEQLHWSTP